jgi:hypothetical protein
VSNRQIKLGAVVGGPGQHYRWLDPEIPGDASVNIDWYLEQAQLAEQAKFDLQSPGRALLGGRPAEHLPVIFQAGAAGHLPGRRLRTGPRPGSHDRRGHLH